MYKMYKVYRQCGRACHLTVLGQACPYSSRSWACPLAVEAWLALWQSNLGLPFGSAVGLARPSMPLQPKWSPPKRATDQIGREKARLRRIPQIPSDSPFGSAVGLARPVDAITAQMEPASAGDRPGRQRESPPTIPTKKSGGIAPAAFVLTDRVASIVQKPSPHRKYYLRAR